MGQRLENETGKNIILRAAREGHTIGNHTYSHPNLKKLSAAEIRSKIERTEESIGECDNGIKLFRPPYGAYNATVEEVVRELGYRMILWNVDSQDWHKNFKGGKWVEHALSQVRVREDSLFLAHDIHKTTVDRVGEFVRNVKRLRNVTFAENA